MTTTASIEFRKDFKELLAKQDISRISNAVRKFCYRSPCDAVKTLWRFTYDSDLSYLGICEMKLTSELISEENISITRNELCFQYKKQNPNFLEVDIPEKCKEEFEILAQKADRIVAKVVYDFCQPHLYIGNPNMQRILFLLKSEKEAYYFGGIRCLGFEAEEAEYLKPFHVEIHDLLKSLFDNMPDEGCVDDLPFYANEDTTEEDSSKEVDNEVEKVESIQNDSKFNPITPEALLMHRDVFNSFLDKENMNILLEIGHLGFDLNEVMRKTEQIRTFLFAAEDLIDKMC